MLAETYDMHLTPEYERARTAFYVKQRLYGAFQIPVLRGDYAFAVPDAPKAGLWGRQLFSRRSTWPEEYR